MFGWWKPRGRPAGTAAARAGGGLGSEHETTTMFLARTAAAIEVEIGQEMDVERLRQLFQRFWDQRLQQPGEA
jgi:hypothetical protein